MDLFYPIQIFANWFVYNLLGFDVVSRLGSSLNFFVYDTVKILVLLLIITHIMGVINVLFPIEKVRMYLTQNKLFGLEYVAASLLGTATPFCSCSSVPLFIGFVKGGIPLGVTLSFLISSPLVDAVVIAMLLGLFGIKVTTIYVLTGIVISVIAGYVLGKLKLEKYLADWVSKLPSEIVKLDNENSTGSSFLKTVSSEAFSIFKNVYLYVLAGVALGALIHGYIPANFFDMIGHSAWSMPVAVLIGIPLYANAAGTLPIAQALVSKGIPLGTVLAFMMATVGLSVPEGLMLKKVMKWQLLAIFFGVVTLAIIISGYFFNVVL